jgi:farnesol dehydrogenase
VAAIAARGHRPVVFARRATAAGLAGEAVDADVRDSRALRDAARGCDAICHTAALVSIWRPDAAEFDDVNVGGLENVLEAAGDANVPRLIYTSSFLALPPAGGHAPITANDYQRTKAAALVVARRARDAGAPIVILFPGVVYGPGARTEGNLVGRLLSDHAAGRLPGLVGGDRIWSFAWIEEVAAAHARAIEDAPVGAEYALGGENAPQRRAFEIAAGLGLGRPPLALPYWAAQAAGWVDELRARATGRPPLVTRGAVEIFRHDWPMDSSKASGDLGYVIHPLEAGIATLVGEIQGSAATAT